MTTDEWLERLGAALGLPVPTEAEAEQLLGVAGVAAHASERTAAPLSCWLIGRSGISIDEARRVIAELSQSAPSSAKTATDPST
jgi:hypothetical protein